MNSISNQSYIPSNSEKRIQPILLPNNSLQSSVITIKIPDGYQVESITKETIELESEIGVYTVKVEQKSDEIIYNRRLEIKAKELPASNNDAFQTFFTKGAKASRLKLVLVEQKT